MKDDVKAELAQFRQLGVERDYGLLLAADIRYSDFDRLRYLLIALNLHALEKDLVDRHIECFRERIRQHEAVACCDLDMAEQWEQDFLEAIPDEHVREHIRQRFESVDGFY